MAIVSLFSWEGYHSLFIIFGLVINTIYLGTADAQTLRKSVVFTCILVFIYNLLEGSYSGMVSETVSWISAILGILRYNLSNAKTQNK